MKRELVLIRGLPGSGKSTMAKSMAGYMHYEADMYFMQESHSGREFYHFDASKVHFAHAWCMKATEDVMAMGFDEDVIVSNTFTTEKELKPYLELAKEYNYRVVSLVVENRHGNESIHGVPEETMQKMERRFSVKLRQKEGTWNI